jgi:hypothetical protein
MGLLTHYTHKLRRRLRTPNSPNSVYQIHGSHTPNTHTHTHTVTNSSSFLGKNLSRGCSSTGRPGGLLYTVVQRDHQTYVLGADQNEEDQTDGASGMYENKKIRIKRFDSKKHKGKRPRIIHKRAWEDNIKVHLAGKSWRCTHYIDLVQNRGRQNPVVKTEINSRIP